MITLIAFSSGTYKRTDNETFLDVGLDINGTKHLDASVGYFIKKVNHGYSYVPKLYLAINSERIAELSGKHNSINSIFPIWIYV